MSNIFEPKNNLILVAYDFTKEAECALNHACNIAQESKSTIELIHIITKESKEKFKSSSVSAERNIQLELEKIATANQEASNIATVANATEGDVFTTIGKIAEQKNAWYLVFGTHGVKGMQHVLGAFALKLVSSSPCPVFIVQDKNIENHGYKNILLPIDRTKESKQKAYQAIALSKIYGCKIHLFATYEKDEYFSISVKANMLFVKSKLEEHNIEVASENYQDPSIKDSFSNQSLKFAELNKIDLILIMTSEDKGIIGAIVGAEDVKIINNEASIPVMCINPVNAMIMGSGISFGGFS